MANLQESMIVGAKRQIQGEYDAGPQRIARRLRPVGAASGLLGLQRSAGNAAVNGLLRRPPASAAEPLSALQRYVVGQHGFKRDEQERLGEKFGTTVSGDTHESEHTIGYDVLKGSSSLTRGRSAPARELENIAPAYQEEKPFHRGHIGTGNRSAVEASGWNARSYRDDQRAALEEGHVGNAVQINQLGYAFNPEFQKPSDDPARAAADDSYQQMVGNMGPVTYASGGAGGDQTHTAGVSAEERAEMELSRRVARGEWLGADGKNGFPPVEEENKVRRKYGLPEV